MVPRPRPTGQSARGGTESVDLNDTPQQAEYRTKVRAWLQEHAKEAPPVRPEGDEDAYLKARREWQGERPPGGGGGGPWAQEGRGQGPRPVGEGTATPERGAPGGARPPPRTRGGRA